ncbi:MAG: RCC1 repeat-containing protein [Planctomycetota bacterium]
MAGGMAYTIALKTDGTLWAWGSNGIGQLGDGTTINKNTPTRIGTDTNWSAIACGWFHTIALKTDGSIWAWGYNSDGQLGDGTTISRTTPTLISATGWSAIACGNSHTIALKTDGSLWAWGDNVFGQLGDGTTTDVTTGPKLISATGWAEAVIACGGVCTVAVKSDGSLWAWGNNQSGQLGDGTTTYVTTGPKLISDTGWSAIAAGYLYTVALKTDGSIWAWGSNDSGQLGDGTTTQRTTPTLISTTGWSAIACGSDHTIALKTDGSLWAWGRNNYGQLGDGTAITRTTSTLISATGWAGAVIACGWMHTIAVKADGSIWAWGYNNSGQLGDGTCGNKKTPSRIGADNIWSAIACGHYYTIAVKADGSIWAWGYNNYGQLGDGTTVNKLTPTPITTTLGWSAIACGWSHTVAVKADGSLWAWGDNSDGQLGDGTTISRTTPTLISTTGWAGAVIACGYSHTCAVKADGSLYAWGFNHYGQLGDGTTTNVTTGPKLISDTGWAGAVIAGGWDHNIALKTDGSLWAWGNNNYGQLGDGTTTDVTTGPKLISATGWAGAVIAGGGSHTVAIKSDGSLWAWGYNGEGQLGDGTTTNVTTGPKLISDTGWSVIVGGIYHTTIGIKSDGSLWAWGFNGYGQLGDGTYIDKNTPTHIGTDTGWSAIAGGYDHTIGIKTDGSLWAWGNNNYGQLGDGTAWRTTPTQIGQ